VTLSFSRVTLAGPLLTMEEARRHLRITGTAYDADIQDKLDAAQEGVLAIVGTGGDETWTPATAPKEIVNAIRLLLAHYYTNRGDDLAASNRADAVIWKELDNVLSKYRDVGIA